MPDTFIQLPTDGTGKMVRARSRTVGANTVYEQAAWLPPNQTWVAYADAVAFAANKHHLTLFNGAGSGVVVKAMKLFAVNLQSAAVTGVFVRFDIMRASASSAGTALTPVALNTANASLPAQVTVRTGATVTEGALLFPYISLNEEETATQALTKAFLGQFESLLFEGIDVQPLTLREGEGVTVKQITSSTVGSFGWIVVFTVET